MDAPRRQATLITDSGRRIVLTPGRSTPEGWSLSVDGTCQSYVDPTQPTYMRHQWLSALAAVADLVLEGIDSPRVLHVGGSLMAVPRRVAALHPGALQVVVEPDTDVLALVDSVVPIPESSRIEVVAGYGEAYLVGVDEDTLTLIVQDAFNGWQVPDSLTSPEYLSHCRRVLGDSGVLAINLIDDAAGRRLAALRQSCLAHFRTVYVAGSRGAVSGTGEEDSGWGNTLVVATNSQLSREAVESSLSGIMARVG